MVWRLDDAERKFGVQGLRHGLQAALLAATNATAPRLHDPHNFDAARACGRGAAPDLEGTIADFPECERRHDKTELRRAYVPERDGWLAPPS